MTRESFVVITLLSVFALGYVLGRQASIIEQRNIWQAKVIAHGCAIRDAGQIVWLDSL